MKPGLEISANLRLVRMLGEGGMGSVWVADHRALGTQVAVKLMSRAVAHDASFVERFRREAGAAAQLKSPHVAQVFDHGVTEDGHPYIVMELLEGEDVHDRVSRAGPQPLAFVAEVIGQAAKALGRAHQLGVVHRDIKPENIFLCDNEGDVLVKVLDFGIAKLPADAAVSVTRTGGTLGTPLYMSPEQLLSAKRVDHHADLWSLAVVAYYMLTARLPFMGETVGAVSVAVHSGVFKPASELRSGLSPEVDAWFRRALEREPADRFGSAKEMAQALRAALDASASPGPVREGAPAGRAAGLEAAPGESRTLLESLPTVAATHTARAPSPAGGAEKPTTDAPRATSQDGRATSQATLSGATVPGTPEPRRRTAAILAALAVGAIAGLLVLWTRDTPAPPRAPATAQEQPADSAPSAITVAPAATESAEIAPPATIAPVISAAPEASGSASASAQASSQKPPPGSQKNGAPAGPPKGPRPTATKDTVGF